MLSRCRVRLAMPRSSASRSSVPRAATATPPWYFSARTVAPTTPASGRSPAARPPPRGARPQPGLAALDVDELRGTQSRAEAGLGDDVVGQPQARAGGD